MIDNTEVSFERQARWPRLRYSLPPAALAAGVACAVLGSVLPTGWALPAMLAACAVIATVAVETQWRTWERRHPKLSDAELSELLRGEIDADVLAYQARYGCGEQEARVMVYRAYADQGALDGT